MTAPQLRLETEVVDKFSRPLKDFQAALRAVGAPKSAKQIKREFDQIDRRVRAASDAVGRGLNAALLGLGLGSLSAAAGLSAAIGAVKSFSTSIGAMRAMSHETGYTVRAMRILEAAAVRFHVAPQSIRSGLKTFAGNLYDFRRQWGATYAEIVRLAPDLAAALRNASPDRAVEIATDFLARIKDRQTANLISKLLFGNADFARLGDEGVAKLRAVLADTSKRIGDLSPADVARAAAFDDAVRAIQTSMEGLRRTIAISAGPEMARFVGWMDKFIAMNRDRIKDGLAATFTAIGNAARAVNDVVEGSVGWVWLIKGYVASKVAKTAVSIVSLGGAFGGLGGAVRAANLLGLAKIFAALGAIGAVVAVSRTGAGSTGQASGPAGGGAGDAGVGAVPPPAVSDPGTARRNENRVGAAVRDGVAKGVARGLEAVAGMGAAGGASGAGGASAALTGGAGGRWSGMSMLRSAASRGRMPAPQALGGQSGKWWTAERQSHAVDYLMKHAGLSEFGAAGLVARWAAVEAKGGPGSRNPRSGAEGIAQWLGSRKRRGVTDTANFDAQLAHAAWELNHTERRAGDALRAARTPWEGARGASMFERAEGYRARTGLDWFTRSTPAGRVHETWAASKAPSPPPPAERGAAIERARAAGALGPLPHKAPLFVRLHGVPRSTRISADGGSGFSDVQVERRRRAAEAGVW